MKYYVKYIVEGFGPQVAGPWNFDEAVEQFRDIRGFEGVSDARLEPEDSDKLPSSA